MTSPLGTNATTSSAANPELPELLQGPLLWSGADLGDDTYTLKLDDDGVCEVESALRTFKTFGLEGDQVSRHNFPLPTLGPRLESCAATIHTGRGFFVLRGLDASLYGDADAVNVYLGLSSYIGSERGKQDRKGNVLSHITNSKQWTTPVEQRHGIHSSMALPFHNDMGCDILALQVRHSAHEGGYTFLSSAWRVFNQLLLYEPDVARTLLACNWPVQVSSNQNPAYYLAPAFTMHEDRLMASMDPNRFGPHPNSDPNIRVPELDASQRHALERVSQVALQSELRLELKTGDLLFLNNWALLHRRDSYNNDGSTERHMVRLWIRNTQLGWSIPISIQPPWLAAYGRPQEVGLYAVSPPLDYKTPKYSAGSAAHLLEDSEESDDGE